MIEEQIGPMRDHYATLMAHPEQIEEVLQAGAGKARAVAKPFLESLRRAVGLRPMRAALPPVGRRCRRKRRGASPSFKQYRESDGRFYFKLVAADGELLLQSDGLADGRAAGAWVKRLKTEGMAALDEAPVKAPPHGDRAGARRRRWRRWSRRRRADASGCLMAAIHITDIESAINWWRERNPSPDGITACAEVRALAEVYALMVYYREAECDEQTMPSRALDAWLAWYASTPDAPCIAICSTSQGDDICKGCGRSFDEVQHWPSMSPAEKRATWRRITREGTAWRFNRYAERARRASGVDHPDPNQFADVVPDKR